MVFDKDPSGKELPHELMSNGALPEAGPLIPTLFRPSYILPSHPTKSYILPSEMVHLNQQNLTSYHLNQQNLTSQPTKLHCFQKLITKLEALPVSINAFQMKTQIVLKKVPATRSNKIKEIIKKNGQILILWHR